MRRKYFKAVLAILIVACIFSCEKKNEKSEMKLTNYQSHGGHRYAITSDKCTWDEAKQFAEQQGGYLVIIESQEENDFVKETYRISLEADADILWIGLSDVAEEGTFRWVNGEIPAYTNWAPGEPNNDKDMQDYGHMYIDGTWDDVEVKDCYAVVEFDN
jgi:hypothetical protein